MPRLSRHQILQHVSPQISRYFTDPGQRVFALEDLSQVLDSHREAWTLAKATTLEDFTNFLVEKKILQELVVTLPYGKTRRFLLPEALVYEIAVSLRKGHYLTHFTALYLHGLVNDVPKTLYTNLEQTEKPSQTRESLAQENIDRAFARPMRRTTHLAEFVLGRDPYTIYLLNGKHVGKVGVIALDYSGLSLPVTSIERTLIDITVRPEYAGGVDTVFAAYQAAQGRFSVNRLVAYLKQMKYVYPYHQAVGFYLEQAGYPASALALLRRLPIAHKFYLTYQMPKKRFSKQWSLFYPEGIFA
jgi:hypothetical protein